LNQVWKIKWRHLTNDCGSNEPRFWQRENVQFIEPNIWPPNSSDLNPVDYAIWGALQQMIYHRQSFVSVDELKRTIVEAWQKLPQSSDTKILNDKMTIFWQE